MQAQDEPISDAFVLGRRFTPSGTVVPLGSEGAQT